MRFAGGAIEQVGEAGVEIDLDQDRHGQQRDDQRLAQDLLALEAEQQHERRQQRDERDGLQRAQQPLRALPARRAPAARGAATCAMITGTTM